VDYAILALALDVVCNGQSLRRQDLVLLTALAEPVNEPTEEALRVLLRELAVALRSASAPTQSVVSRGPLVSRTDFE
jgi:hypothetical protein